MPEVSANVLIDHWERVSNYLDSFRSRTGQIGQCSVMSLTYYRAGLTVFSFWLMAKSFCSSQSRRAIPIRLISGDMGVLGATRINGTSSHAPAWSHSKTSVDVTGARRYPA